MNTTKCVCEVCVFFNGEHNPICTCRGSMVPLQWEQIRKYKTCKDFIELKTAKCCGTCNRSKQTNYSDLWIYCMAHDQLVHTTSACKYHRRDECVGRYTTE